MSDFFYPEDEPSLWDAHWAETYGLTEPAWWDEDITLYDDNFNAITMTGQEWYDYTLTTDEETRAEIGLDILTIIYQLEDSYYWGPEEWEEWRDLYAALAG